MADFYGTEDGFEEYCERNGYALPAGEIEPALYRASMYIDATYGMRFSGYKTGGRDQQRAWPRYNAYDIEGWYYLQTDIPWQVEHATYEAARREMVTPGSLAPDIVTGQIKKSVSIVGAVAVEYAIGSADARSQTPILTVIGGILAPLLGSSAPSFTGRRVRG